MKLPENAFSQDEMSKERNYLSKYHKMGTLITQIIRNSVVLGVNKKILKFPFTIATLDRRLSFAPYLLTKQNVNTAKTDNDGKKNKASIKITLYGPDDTISITTIEEAQKLAKRRTLNLVKLLDLDVKTHRPVYKLFTVAELLAKEAEDPVSVEDKKSSHVKKGEKNLTISHKITDHDLGSRLKNITKWLTKSCEVRILIQSTAEDLQSGERIFNKIESHVKQDNLGRIVQKRVKGGNIKFSIFPTKTES